jgi:uncharacterized membrane protein YtjA (UPF0391 family)
MVGFHVLQGVEEVKLAVVVAVLGARGVAGLSVEIAKWLVVIFVGLAVISLVL